MTKKSEARQMRDAQEKAFKDQQLENRCWDDLRDIYSKCQMSINNVVAKITGLYSIDGLGSMIPNRQEVAVQLRGLARDQGEFQKELLSIYALHSDKVGGSEDSYLNRQALDIFESYRNWQAKFEAVFVPTVEQLIAVVAEVGQRIHNQSVAEQAAAQQTEVVTQ